MRSDIRSRSQRSVISHQDRKSSIRHQFQNQAPVPLMSKCRQNQKESSRRGRDSLRASRVAREATTPRSGRRTSTVALRRNFHFVEVSTPGRTTGLLESPDVPGSNRHDDARRGMSRAVVSICGEGGIRTLGSLLSYARLASGYLRPLGHLSRPDEGDTLPAAVLASRAS